MGKRDQKQGTVREKEGYLGRELSNVVRDVKILKIKPSLTTSAENFPSKRTGARRRNLLGCL